METKGNLAGGGVIVESNDFHRGQKRKLILRIHSHAIVVMLSFGYKRTNLGILETLF